MHRRNAVVPRHLGEAFSQRREMRGVGADIADIGAAKAEEFAVLVERQLGRNGEVAALIVADEAFGAVAIPLDRAADLARGPRQKPVFREECVARAEIAAHVAAQRAAFLFRHAQNLGERLPLAHDAAAGAGINGVAPGLRIEIADRRARLHRRAGDALDPGVELCHVRGLGKRSVGCRAVADLAVGAEIAGTFVPDARRAGFQRVRRTHHGGKRLVVYLDQLGRVLRRHVRVRDHHRHRLADEARLVGCDDRDREAEQLRPRKQPDRHVRHALDRGGMRDGIAAVGQKIGAGEDRDHARRFFRAALVDRADARMRVRRAHDRRERHVRQHDVRKIAPAAGEKAQILLARNRLSDAG